MRLQFEDGIFDELHKVHMEFMKHTRFQGIKHDYDLVVEAIQKYLNSVEDYEYIKETLNTLFECIHNFGLDRNPLQDDRIFKEEPNSEIVHFDPIPKTPTENTDTLPTSEDHILMPMPLEKLEDKSYTDASISKTRTSIPKHEKSNKEILSKYNFIIPSHPNAKSVDEGIDFYLNSLSISQNTLKNYKYGMARYLRCCHDNEWDPNVEFDDAVKVIINYFATRIKDVVLLKTLLMEKGTIKKYYEMMGRGDNNPVLDKRVRKMLRNLKKEPNGHNCNKLNSFVEKIEAPEKESSLSDLEIYQEIPNTKNTPVFSDFDPILIPTQPSAKCLEDGLNIYLLSLNLSMKTISSYKRYILKYLNALRLLDLDPNATYDLAVQNAQIYFKYRICYCRKSDTVYNIGYANAEKTGIKRYYDMMNRGGSRNPISDSRVIETINKYLNAITKPQVSNKQVDQSEKAIGVELSGNNELIDLILEQKYTELHQESVNEIIDLTLDSDQSDWKVAECPDEEPELMSNSPQLDDNTCQETPILGTIIEEEIDSEEELQFDKGMAIVTDEEFKKIEFKLEKTTNLAKKWESILNLVESGDYNGLIPIIEAKNTE